MTGIGKSWSCPFARVYIQSGITKSYITPLVPSSKNMVHLLCRVPPTPWSHVTCLFKPCTSGRWELLSPIDIASRWKQLPRKACKYVPCTQNQRDIRHHSAQNKPKLACGHNSRQNWDWMNDSSFHLTTSLEWSSAKLGQGRVIFIYTTPSSVWKYLLISNNHTLHHCAII